MTSLRPAPARAAPAAAVVVAILLLGFNLRGPIVAVSPVVDTIRDDLGIGEATAGLFTSLPVLCFGLATPFASILLARAGLGRGVTISLVVLLAGIGLRSADGLVGALSGTLLIGIATTVGNVAVPVVIARDLSGRSGAALGAYTASLNVGSMVTLALTVPIADALGWRAALLVWGGLVVVAAVAWEYAVRPADGSRDDDTADGAGESPARNGRAGADRRPRGGAVRDLRGGAPADAPAGPAGPGPAGPDPAGPGPAGPDPAGPDPAGPDPAGPGPAGTGPGRRPWWRRPVVWGLTAAFSGQAFAYYGITAWLPLLLRDELGMGPAAAGTSASIFQIAALVGAFGVPVLLRLLPGPRWVVLTVVAGWVTLPVGLLLAPQLWALWCGLGGVAQGGGLTVIFALVVRHARDLTENRRMSATVQGCSYVVASSGPTVVGAVHAATAGWTAPLLVVLGSVALFGAAGAAVAGPRAVS